VREGWRAAVPNQNLPKLLHPRIALIVARPKAVLKHSQSKRWREVWGVPANAKRLDCVRFIAAFPAGAPPQAAASFRVQADVR